jgi:diguanylate cyclase (GGDEF)-like protein
MLVQIVDDSDINRAIFAAVVERLGDDVVAVCFAHAAEALAEGAEAMPDLIVLDFMMPGMDGHEFVAKVRALPGAKAVPIVMITAATERQVRHRALDLGVTDFLTKPLDSYEMRARLANLIALRRGYLQLQDRSRWLAEEVRKATEKTLHLASHDPLTNLPNRVLLHDRLGQALARAGRSGERVAVLCLDLDRFKRVNDTLGHAGGDLLLQRIAARFRDSVREADTVARLGGDEFAIVQVGAAQPAGAMRLAERLSAALRDECGADGAAAEVGVSIGVAFFPEDGSDPDTLLKRGDLALYRAKAEGRGGCRVFEPDMDARLQERRALEKDLRAAIAAAGLSLHYQPLAATATNGIVGFEALARWQHPVRGPIGPAEFIPVAEESGLIRPLGEWVLHAACSEAARWPSHLRLTVNLSPLQVRADLPRLVADVLRGTGLEPGRLELEVTEGVLIRDTENTLAVLRELKALGVRIAMDDFGTGYSSLSYLRRFPFDRIKIDRSFVADLLARSEAVPIIRAIVSLGAGLRMGSTAEGVETPQQLAVLREESCEEVQGYLIGRPLPVGELRSYLARVAHEGAPRSAHDGAPPSGERDAERGGGETELVALLAAAR